MVESHICLQVYTNVSTLSFVYESAVTYAAAAAAWSSSSGKVLRICNQLQQLARVLPSFLPSCLSSCLPSFMYGKGKSMVGCRRRASCAHTNNPGLDFPTPGCI